MNKRDSQSEKPSFFSMRSPTLDAIARKLKSMMSKNTATQDFEASDSILQSTKPNKNNSDNTNELPKPQATVSSDKSNTTTAIESLKLPNSNSAESDEKNTVDNMQLEGQISTKADNTGSKEDLNVEPNHSDQVSEKPSLADDTSRDEKNAHESNEATSKHDSEKDVLDSKESKVKSNQTDDLLKPISAQKNEAKQAMEQANVSQDKPSSIKNDIKDAIETVVKEDFNEQTNFSDSDLDSTETFTEAGDNETGVVSKTLFKPNSVLGKLDDQILKSFSQKKVTKTDDSLL